MDDDENGQVTKKHATVVLLILFKFLNIFCSFTNNYGLSFFYLVKTTYHIKNVRILFNSGAQLNYISSEACKQLHFKKILIKTFRKGVLLKNMSVAWLSIK